MMVFHEDWASLPDQFFASHPALASIAKGAVALSAASAIGNVVRPFAMDASKRFFNGVDAIGRGVKKSFVGSPTNHQPDQIQPYQQMYYPPRS